MAYIEQRDVRSDSLPSRVDTSSLTGFKYFIGCVANFLQTIEVVLGNISQLTKVIK